MPSRKSKAPPKWSIHPYRHDDVASLLEEDNLQFSFHNNDDAVNCVKEYDTNVMGRFTCQNPACGSSGWSSMKIAITIRMYSGSRYNARVYHQRCQKCNKLAEPHLDDSYAERVAYRLKKWRGIAVDQRAYNRDSKGPHRKELCEGCRVGHCTETTNRA